MLLREMYMHRIGSDVTREESPFHTDTQTRFRTFRILSSETTSDTVKYSLNRKETYEGCISVNITCELIPRAVLKIDDSYPCICQYCGVSWLFV